MVVVGDAVAAAANRAPHCAPRLRMISYVHIFQRFDWNSSRSKLPLMINPSRMLFNRTFRTFACLPKFSVLSGNFFPVVDRSSIRKLTMATAMAKRLEGKTIVVTGASSGIGKSTGHHPSPARSTPKSSLISPKHWNLHVHRPET